MLREILGDYSKQLKDINSEIQEGSSDSYLRGQDHIFKSSASVSKTICVYVFWGEILAIIFSRSSKMSMI